METYLIISKRNGKVLGTIEALSRVHAISLWAKPGPVSAVRK